MTEKARVSKGVPAGGEFTATAHTEPAVELVPHRSASEQIAQVTAALVNFDARWETEKADLAAQSEAHTQRRRRFSGARTASRLLKDFPDAVTMTYTRDPLNGLITMESIEDANDYTLFDASEMDGSAFAGSPDEVRRKVAVRQSVRRLSGATLPPEHAAQGITVQESHGTETIHLPTALADGYAQLEAEELTPEQTSAQRIQAALSHWDETDDDPQTTMRDLLTDLRHHAAANGLDLGEALDGSYKVFLEEHNDPAFKEGF
jgi:antitoxin (DNA-binding transcriptional repressor) of toxin-antitoxin stability system